MVSKINNTTGTTNALFCVLAGMYFDVGLESSRRR